MRAAVVLLVITGAALMLMMWHPSTLPFIPPCPTKLLFGVDCPGCGSLRGVHHVMNLRIDQAWQLNPALLVVGLPALALLMTDVLGTVIWRSRMQFIPQARFGIVLGVALVVYSILRNVV